MSACHQYVYTNITQNSFHHITMDEQQHLVVTMTKAPSLRSLRAVCSPILILPPVTIANLPDRSLFTWWQVAGGG